MELVTWNFVHLEFKTIQFDTEVVTKLKGIIASINPTIFIWENLKEISKFDDNFGKKKHFFGKKQ